MAKNKPILNRHHIIYACPEHRQGEIVATIYKGEHWLLTNLSRRKNISKGFCKSLRVWLALNEDKAIDLDKP